MQSCGRRPKPIGLTLATKMIDICMFALPSDMIVQQEEAVRTVDAQGAHVTGDWL